MTRTELEHVTKVYTEKGGTEIVAVDDVGTAERITLGVRPEDVELVSAASTDHDFEATVDVVEPTGNENNVYLTFDPADEEPKTFVATVEGTRHIEPGARVVARILEEAIHLFDGKTGAALKNRKLETAKTAHR